MPEKSPDFWAALAAWWTANQASAHGVFLAAVIAMVRVIYGGGRLRQMILEGALCGLATLALIPALEYLGLPESMASFAGGMVGFLGVEKIRELAERFGGNKVS